MKGVGRFAAIAVDRRSGLRDRSQRARPTTHTGIQNTVL